jgi:hypothetical protein
LENISQTQADSVKKHGGNIRGYHIWGVLLMDQTSMKWNIGTEIEQLSAVEKMVYEALSRSNSEYHDIYLIAKQCKLTELQVMVSIQLLIHKKLLPIVKDKT